MKEDMALLAWCGSERGNFRSEGDKVGSELCSSACAWRRGPLPPRLRSSFESNAKDKSQAKEKEIILHVTAAPPHISTFILQLNKFFLKTDLNCLNDKHRGGGVFPTWTTTKRKKNKKLLPLNKVSSVWELVPWFSRWLNETIGAQSLCNKNTDGCRLLRKKPTEPKRPMKCQNVDDACVDLKKARHFLFCSVGENFFF